MSRMITMEITNLDAAVVPVESANLSPITYPAPMSTVVESGANRCNANGVFARKELNSDRLLRNILPHGDGLRLPWLEDLHLFKRLTITEFLPRTSLDRRTSSEPDLSLGNWPPRPISSP